VAYPKLSAAIDEFLAKQVKENGEAAVMALLEWAQKPLEVPEVVAEKSVPIPVSTGEEAKL